MVMITRTTLLLTLASTTLFASEKRVKMADLPEAVQKTVKEQTNSAQLVGVSKDVENGKTFYEAETRANGKTRDVLIDSTGTVVEVEQEVTLDSIPEAAKKAIQTKAGSGKIVKVESVTKGSTVTYEAALSKHGKKSEVVVTADGVVK